MSSARITHERAEIRAKIDELRKMVLIETKVLVGAQHMLQVSRSTNGGTIPQSEVIAQVNMAQKRIIDLQRQLDHYESLNNNSVDDGAGKWRNRAGSTPSTDPSFHQAALRRRAPSVEVGDRVGSDGNRHTSDYSKTIQDLVASLNSNSLSEDAQLAALDGFVRLLKQCNAPTQSVPLTQKLLCIIPCLISNTLLVRASAYRVLRYLSCSEKNVEALLAYRVDVYMMRTLVRDTNTLTEKEQCIKLLRSWLDISFRTTYPSTPTLKSKLGVPPRTHPAPLVSTTIIRVLVSLADHYDDKLRLLAIETLCELALSTDHLPVVARAGGIRSLCLGMLDCPREVTEFIVLTILNVIDSPKSREYVRRGVDIEVVASAFSDAYGKGPQLDTRFVTATRAVLAFFRHWTGILYMVRDDFSLVRALVDSLRIPYNEHKMAVLSLLQALFRFDDPCDYSPKPERLDLQGHTTSLLLLIFVKAGLFEALIDLIGESEPTIMNKATALIGSLIELCNQVLPEHMAIHVQSLPGLFELASRFRYTEQVRHRAISVLAHIDQSAVKKPGGLVTDLEGVTGNSLRRTTWASTTADPTPSSSKVRTDHVKVQMGLSMDESVFRAMLMDSGVLSAKSREYTKWDWTAITELLQGPLLSAKRVEDTLKSSKFFKRLTSFFRPSKRIFCDLPVNRTNVRFIKLGSLLVSCLLMSPEGGQFLSENKLLNEVVVALTGVDPSREGSTSHQLLAVSRLEKTLTMGYFSMLGSMAKSEMGLQILSHFRFFTLFYHLSEITARHDIMRILVVSLDYSREGHCRIVLSKFLSSSMEEIRIFATRHLGTVLKSAPTPANIEWMVPLLLTQLYDPVLQVQQLAISILDMACELESKTRSTIVQLSPTLDHLGELGSPLFIRLLATSEGFEYLRSTGYVDREYLRWCEHACQTYVDRVELSYHQSIAKNLVSTSPFERTKYEDVLFYGNSSDNGYTHPHYFGELAKTQEGVQMFRSNPHFLNMCRRLRENWANLVLLDPVEVKAILWAIGHVGCTKIGILYLQDETALEGDIISVVCDIAAECPILTVRGTAFHALGLIAKTARGREWLQLYGWICDQDHGFVLPDNLGDLIMIDEWMNNPWEPDTSIAEPMVDEIVNRKEMDEVSREIIDTIASFNNQVLNKTSLRNLVRLRAQYPRHFQSTSLYLNVVQLYNRLHFRFAARKFIEDRFDQLQLRNLHLLSPAPLPSAHHPLPTTQSPHSVGHSNPQVHPPAQDPHTKQSSSSSSPEAATHLSLDANPSSFKPQVIVNGFHVPILNS